MINFEFKEKCYSCMACAEICPVKAISFNENLHPLLDIKKCIKCDGCEKVCIELNNPQIVEDMNNVEGYIVKNKNNEIRQLSSSGGVFFQIAKEVLDINGYVCGCVYDYSFMPKHIISNDLDICKQMMGSKYIKSDLSGCITKMKQIVAQGHIMLFTGLPCQVAAVKRCIHSKKLITLAVVCHGSIERRIWKRFLVEETQCSPIVQVSMRDKTKGYLNYGLKFEFKDGTVHVTYRKTDGYFLKCFTDGLFERDRCLSCAYKGQNIGSDLLLGDAWGMEKVLPKFVDNLGCSAVLVLTSKGKNLFEKILDSFDVEKIESEVIVKNNPRINSPASKNPFQKGFEKKINGSRANIHVLTEKYAKPTILNRIKWKLAKWEK